MIKEKQVVAEQNSYIRTERVFVRFRLGQRWEHMLLFLSMSVLLLTGLPQKYRTTSWSQLILATPEKLELIQTIHHIAAIVLMAEVVYHIGQAVYLLAKRKLSAEMFVTWQDVKDAGKMIAYLLFIRKEKPRFGKYTFEEKVTYWFFFIGVGIMVITGLVLLFPLTVTRFLPGSVIPAAMMAHSTEAIVAGIFIIIWHVFHVHIQRLNLSIFTGKINEEDMKKYHPLEYEKLTGKKAEPDEGNKQ
jgi:formate dehydrogenase gamma subunit